MLDKVGNLAAATSTGGLANKMPGSIGDSSMIGVGCYASNKTCAVSSTGDGEVLIRHVMAFHLSSLMAYKGMPLKEAARWLVHNVLKEEKGDRGIIAIDPAGNIALEFSTPRMHRGFKTGEEEYVAIYPDEQL